MRMDDAQWSWVMAKAHMTLSVRWAKKKSQNINFCGFYGYDKNHKIMKFIFNMGGYTC
jgi:hypothetical protein